MRVKATEGKTKDVAIADVTPENYIVPQGEEHLFHAVIEVTQFDRTTGKRLSVPSIQKFGKKGWETTIASDLKKQGYTITVLHDPNEWLETQMKAKAAQSAENQKAKAEAQEQARKEAEEKAASERKAEIDATVKQALDAQSAENQKAIDKAVADAVAKATKGTKTDGSK